MRQKDIETMLRMTAEGYTDKQIAEHLHYAETTVKNLRLKLGVYKGRGRRKKNVADKV